MNYCAVGAAVASALAAVLFTSCGGGGCPPVYIPAIVVNVFDVETGEPLCGANGMILPGGGTVTDMRPWGADDCGSTLEGGGGGISQVVVSRNGYEDWISEEIQVEQDSMGCSPVTVSLEVRLKPNS